MSEQIERGTYEVIRDRLLEQARQLGSKAEGLNKRRLELFGGAEMSVAGNERIRTENNCIPRDIVAVGDRLLFGYNVFIGLRTETRVQDVFSLHSFEPGDKGYAIESIPLEGKGQFLADPRFVEEFKELYRYYKDSRLLQLRNLGTKLLAIFQIGKTVQDLRVFRWALNARGKATYIDNRGERDHVFPRSHDFEWTPTGRENFVLGRHPHVNILDEVFVETVGGDLTVKVEDNTQDGRGIYREPVEDADQSLDDAQIHFAKVGVLILLKVLPFREEQWRYLVFNTRTHKVDRIDAIGQACVELPEDHGVIFPGGYYLQDGEIKVFDRNTQGMEFQRSIPSPNGEDVLYIFHRRGEGLSILLNYNMIRKEVDNPIYCHGFGRFPDGTMVIFRAASEEPTRVHPMQIWKTPFCSDEYQAKAPATGSYLEKVGNADLVRGISDCLTLRRAILEQAPSRQIYEDLIAAATRTLDSYYWLGHQEAGELQSTLTEIRSTAELIIDEFEKVEAVRMQAEEAVAQAQGQLTDLFRSLRPASWTALNEFVEALTSLRSQRGHLITLREMRYIDLERIDQMEAQVVERFDEVSGHAVQFLQDEKAFQPYREQIEDLAGRSEQIDKVAESTELAESLKAIGDGLDLLTEVVGALEIEDATVRTQILEQISELLGALNRSRALLQNRRKELLSEEGVAEFAAQFKVFGQNVTGALAVADTPEKCEEQLSRLMLQLEELESRFSEFEQFLEQLNEKREEVYEAFTSKKQRLLDERQRRAQHVMQASERILQGIQRRVRELGSEDELNAFFATDPMVAKVRELSGRLRQLQDSVRADEVDARLKTARQDAGRALRDRLEIYEEGENVIKLGKHRFSVNTQPLDLTMVPRDGQMHFHLTGTGFFEAVADADFQQTRPFWDQHLVSESPRVYRGEYLAACLLAEAEEEQGGLSLEKLRQAALEEKTLLELVRQKASQRYEEGYERGIHDADAAHILARVLELYTSSGLLRFAPLPRALASLFWAYAEDKESNGSLQRRARSLSRLRRSFAHSPAIAAFTQELGNRIGEFCGTIQMEANTEDAHMAGTYLFEELSQEPLQFARSDEASALLKAFSAHLKESGSWRDFEEDLKALQGDLSNRHRLASAWLTAFLDQSEDEELTRIRHILPEAVALLLTEGRLERSKSPLQPSASSPQPEVTGLLGQHPLVQKRRLPLRLDEFLSRLGAFRHQRVPAFRVYLQQRHQVLEQERRQLRLAEYQPRVMTSFVRNQLINEAYLPLIGDNLAKQIGALGEGKRTDLMGLLLLISPPGYGKTTLMEYLASRLGLVFVKVNGPSMGHSVTSLDPAEAPNATARQEVEKINLAFEMGNNVLLYIDDIQHTHSEFLQKFISLCDAQRRVEGVWKGETRSYDMRGKKFCVCMAGNPYTESGEKFRIPDMLANRADIYNLGDILEGKDEMFALSYLENALTSNPILAPLTTRPQQDVYLLVRMAQGEQIQSDQLAYGYSGAELEDVLSVLRKLIQVQQVLLRVNQEYIYSASQEEAFRTEPAFLLQGSYRNMNKLAEKVVPVMNEKELEALIDDHYQGEAQTLTTGAEANLLKLAELRGRMSDSQKKRWEEIKQSFRRIQVMGASDEDPVARVVGQIGLVSERLGELGRTIQESAALRTAAEAAVADEGPALAESLAPVLQSLGEKLSAQDGGWGLEASARITEVLEGLSCRLEQIGQKLVESAKAPREAAQPADTPSEMASYLAKLDATLSALAAAPGGGHVVQTLPSSTYELLDEMASKIEQTLMPLVRSLARGLEGASEEKTRRLRSQLDKTLKQFDALKDYLNTLKKIDTRSLAGREAEGRKSTKGTD